MMVKTSSRIVCVQVFTVTSSRRRSTRESGKTKPK